MAPRYLLIEPGKEARWLDAGDVVEIDIPDVKIPTEVPMKNYKWTPTFHGSLKPEPEPKTEEVKGLPEVAVYLDDKNFFEEIKQVPVHMLGSLKKFITGKSNQENSSPKVSFNSPIQSKPEYTVSEEKYVGEIYALGFSSPQFLVSKNMELEAYKTPITSILAENSMKGDPLVQTASSKTKTKTKPKKPVSKTPKKKAAPAIFQWTFQSSQDVGGQKAVYSTLLRSNGDMTCNCPGWIFKRGDDRFCKHTKMVETEAKGLYKDHKAGKELPAMELVGAGNIATAANPKKEGDLKYGRRIILD